MQAISDANIGKTTERRKGEERKINAANNKQPQTQELKGPIRKTRRIEDSTLLELAALTSNNLYAGADIDSS